MCTIPNARASRDQSQSRASAIAGREGMLGIRYAESDSGRRLIVSYYITISQK